jgi:hypothetical protein
VPGSRTFRRCTPLGRRALDGHRAAGRQTRHRVPLSTLPRQRRTDSAAEGLPKMIPIDIPGSDYLVPDAVPTRTLGPVGAAAPPKRSSVTTTVTGSGMSVGVSKTASPISGSGRIPTLNV